MEDDCEYDIAITNTCAHNPSPDSLLRGVVKAALIRHNAGSARIDVALVDDAEIARLNGLHRGHRRPTDVLSFDLSDEGGADGRERSERPAGLEGEIVVSVDTAARTARERGHSVDAELALYAVHGTLHLLGYDDNTKKKAAEMHELEDGILTSLGLGSVYRSLAE